jgi:hypothetical protein
VRSLEDLIDFQEGREKVPIFQVGKGEKMNSTEGSYHQGMLTGEDHKYILIIGELRYSFQVSKSMP